MAKGHLCQLVCDRETRERYQSPRVERNRYRVRPNGSVSTLFVCITLISPPRSRMWNGTRGDRELQVQDGQASSHDGRAFRTVERWRDENDRSMAIVQDQHRITSVKEGMGEYDLRRMANEVYFETFTDARWYMKRRCKFGRYRGS